MNYGELQSLVLFYLHRTDMADKVPSFIELAGERIGRDARLHSMIVEEELSFDSDTLPLPDRFAAIKAFASADGLPLQYQDNNNFDRFVRAARGIGSVEYYTIRGGSLWIGPGAGSVATPIKVRATYFARPEKMTSSNDQNVVLESHPQLYLFATLAYAHNAIQDLGSEQVADQNYFKELNRAIESDVFGMSGSPSMSGL